MKKLQRSPFHVAVFRRPDTHRTAGSQERTAGAVVETGHQVIADLQRGGVSTAVAAALLKGMAAGDITNAEQLPDSYRGLGALAGLE